MNNHDAKFLLRAYRPGGDDSADPRMAAALEQARRDPELGAWLTQEQSFDAAMAEKLRAVTPPAGLRAAILAGGRVSGAVEAPETTSRAWWRGARAQWLGLAAAVAVVAATAWTIRPGAGGKPGFGDLAREALHELHGAHGAPTLARDVGVVGAWLQDPASRLAAGMPVELARLRTDGCRAVKVSGRELFEVCFFRDGAEYHFYVGRREDFSIPAGEDGPMVVAQGGKATLAWADARHVYMLAGEGDGTALKNLL